MPVYNGFKKQSTETLTLIVEDYLAALSDCVLDLLWDYFCVFRQGCVMEKNCEDSDTAIYKYQNREAITSVTGPVTDITTTHYDFTD